MLWRRGKSYSQDLRERVFAAADDGERVGRIAIKFRVSVSYVSKVLSRRARDRRLIGGIMLLWQRPGRHRRSGEIAAQTQHRVCHYRLRNELAAADRRRFATTASVAICSSAG